MRHRLSSVLGLVLAAPAAAQATLDETLLIERPQDRAGRLKVAQKLARVKLTLNAEEMPPVELAKAFATWAGGELNFVVMSKATKPSELPPVTLTLKEHGMLQAMALVHDVSDLRFVYRSGMILLKPKDEVKELKVLRIYERRAALAQLRDHPGPKLGLGRDGTELADWGEVDSDKTLSGWTIDQVMDLLRNHVAPESWDAEGASMSTMGGALYVRQTARNQAKVQALLVELGVIAAPRVVVRERPARALPAARPKK